MNETILTESEAIDKLVAALAIATLEFPVIEKTAVVSFKQKDSNRLVEYLYAPLDVINKAVTKPLAKNGLVIMHVISKENEKNILKTRLYHSSGQWLESKLEFQNYSNAKDLGSILTYYRRYQVCGLLNLAAEEDDDAERIDQSQTQAEPGNEESKGEEIPKKSTMPRVGNIDDLKPGDAVPREFWQLSAEEKAKLTTAKGLKTVKIDGIFQVVKK